MTEIVEELRKDALSRQNGLGEPDGPAIEERAADRIVELEAEVGRLRDANPMVAKIVPNGIEVNGQIFVKQARLNNSEDARDRALSALTAAQGEIKTLREALEPFAFRISERIGDGGYPDSYEVQAKVPMHEIRAARQALSTSPSTDTMTDAEKWAGFESDEALIDEVAKAIAENGFGRSWEDFHETCVSDTDKDDLREYAKAAIDAIPNSTIPDTSADLIQAALERERAISKMHEYADGRVPENVERAVIAANEALDAAVRAHRGQS